MKLKSYIDEADYFSAKASDISRNFAFAGIAIIWIFKISKEDFIDLPNELYLPLLLFVFSLFLDLLQYIIGYLLWSRYVKKQEDEGKKVDDDVTAIGWQSKFINILWMIKIGVNFCGFICLMLFLFNKLQ